VQKSTPDRAQDARRALRGSWDHPCLRQTRSHLPYPNLNEVDFSNLVRPARGNAITPSPLMPELHLHALYPLHSHYSGWLSGLWQTRRNMPKRRRTEQGIKRTHTYTKHVL
jgi:hypothetical protein